MFYDQGLKTLDQDGKVPTTRMENADDARNRVQAFLDADNASRARKRALVKGLVDGNPPYKISALKKAGRGDACNVNWRIAESFISDAMDLMYDIFSEAPRYAEIQLGDHVKDSERAQKSKIVSEEFDRMMRRDRCFDSNMQISQHETVLYGIGPLAFEDKYSLKIVPILAGELQLPEFAPSDVTEWEECAIIKQYSPHKLYQWIANAEAAGKAGWNVKAVKNAIMMAHPRFTQGGLYKNWDWHQQQIKNGAYSYSAEGNRIEVAHYFYREFPKSGEEQGGITHAIVLLGQDFKNQDYLFHVEREFERWEQIVHPMYYNYMGGGYFHAITGMGVKMYSAMEYQNRLLCKIAEDAFAPKTIFKPTTAQADQVLSIARLGPFGKMPAGFEMQQMPVGGFLEEGIAMNREISGVIASNLSQFRQNLQKNTGNPLSATEASLRSQNQAQLGKSQLARYYMQLDWVYEERFKRAINPKMPAGCSGYYEAQEFKRRLKARGVTMKDLEDPEYVRASRIVGQGSVFMRQQALERMMGIVNMLPEGGRESLITDYVSSLAGQAMANRYVPTQPDKPMDDHVLAALQLSAMKDGIAPVVTDEQNHIIFAQVFLEGAAASVASLQQGANPQEVLQFLEMVGPAIFDRLRRFGDDPSRKTMHQALFDQWKKLAQITDELRKGLERQAQQQQQQQEQANQSLMDEQVEMMIAQREQARLDAMTSADIQRKQQKAQVDISTKARKAEQQLAINDLMTAQEVRNNGKEKD